MRHDNSINCRNITIRGGKIYGGGQELRENIINGEQGNIYKEYVKNVLYDGLFIGGVDYFDKGDNLHSAIEFFGRKIDTYGISDIEIKNIKLNKTI